MTQEERWIAKYNEVVDFIETNHRNPSRHPNHRNPSRHRIEEHDMLNWLKANRKARGTQGRVPVSGILFLKDWN